MNDTLSKFFEESKQLEQEEMNRILDKLGIYDKKFAPFETTCNAVILDGEKQGTNVKFVWENEKVKVGQKTTVQLKNKSENVQINSCSYNECTTYPDFQDYKDTIFDEELQINRHYIKIPIEITDDEYSAVLKTKKAQYLLAENKKEHEIINSSETVGTNTDTQTPILPIILNFIAVIIYICGLFYGISVGETSVGLMFSSWLLTLLFGTLLIAAGTVIKHLNSIDKKLSK